MTLGSSQVEILAPLAAPLPDGPASDAYFTTEQWITLMAIMDAVIPSITRGSGSEIEGKSQLSVKDEEYTAAVEHLRENVVDAPEEMVLEEYLREKPSDSPAFQGLLRRLLIHYTPEEARKGLGFVLSTLKSVWTFLLCLL